MTDEELVVHRELQFLRAVGATRRRKPKRFTGHWRPFPRQRVKWMRERQRKLEEVA